jgi:recombinational DNA repair protein (RecF pathway)
VPKKIDPELAEKVMLKAGLRPLENFKFGHLPWRCFCTKCEKVVTPSYANVRNGHAGCAYCAGKKVDPVDAVALMRSKNLEPLEPFKSLKSKWKCRCLTCNSLVEPTYGVVSSGSGGCLKCGYEAAGNKNRMSEKTATEIMLTAGLRPLEKYKNFESKWLSECLRCGAIVKPRLHSISSGQGGCINCGIKIRSEKNRIPPEQARKTMLKHGYIPQENFVEAGKPWKSIHEECGRVVKPRYASIKNGFGGCKYCGQEKAAEKNRFSQDEAIKLMRAAGLEPLEPYVNSTTKWNCTHLACGRKVKPQLFKIQNGQTGCRACGYLTMAGKNLRESTGTVREMLNADLQPLEPYQGTEHRWKCRCLKCNKIVYPRHHSVVGGQGGCKYCATNGMDYKAPGYVYLIVHHDYDALKVGIGGTEKRLKQHTIFGWKLVSRWNFVTGHKASLIEERILKHLRQDLKLAHFLSREDMPQAGHTETFSLDQISVTYVRDMINRFTKTKSPSD